mmetsp:Transcript_5128/g.11648  ORF Transcript_5128/g.11648 Transcript_5128/m.11648 type:complete len:96 (+) Transcript_5128:439-726(+)
MPPTAPPRYDYLRQSLVTSVAAPIASSPTGGFHYWFDALSIRTVASQLLIDIIILSTTSPSHGGVGAPKICMLIHFQNLLEERIILGIMIINLTS